MARSAFRVKGSIRALLQAIVQVLFNHENVAFPETRIKLINMGRQ
jgi:hypothetical protein